MTQLTPYPIITAPKRFCNDVSCFTEESITFHLTARIKCESKKVNTNTNIHSNEDAETNSIVLGISTFNKARKRNIAVSTKGVVMPSHLLMVLVCLLSEVNYFRSFWWDKIKKSCFDFYIFFYLTQSKYISITFKVHQFDTCNQMKIIHFNKYFFHS